MCISSLDTATQFQLNGLISSAIARILSLRCRIFDWLRFLSYSHPNF